MTAKSRRTKTRSHLAGQLLLRNKWIITGVELTLLVIIALTGLWIRLHPFFFVSTVLDFLGKAYPEARSLSPDILQYGYLFGNDPWIEYWLSKYIYTNGISSWTSLTQNNPATHLFWYPWGRDFASSEYPLIPLLTGWSYSLVDTHMSLQQWIALLPPIAALLMILVGYLYIRSLYGRWAALLAAALLAMLPASFDRTHAGFVEKEGIAMPILILGFYLASLALKLHSKRDWITLSVASGLVFSIISITWGGYFIIPLIIAVSALLVPLAPRTEETLSALWKLLVIGAAFTAFTVIFYLTLFKGIRIKTLSIVSIGGPLLAIAFHAVSSYLHQKMLKGKYLWLAKSPRRIYLVLFIVSATAAILALPYIGITGRAYYIIAWPLRSRIKFHPLVESVAEHQPLIGSASFYEINAILFTGIIGALIILLYNHLKRGRVHELPLGVMAIGVLYSVIGMAYLLQTAGVFGALATAAIMGVFSATQGEKRARKRTTRDTEEIRLVAMALVVILLASIVAYNAYAATTTMNRVPNILTANTNTVNPAWLITLDVLQKTPNNTIIVTWWDYGYWVSVGAHRATLADGATINSTQIEILAKMLISNENISSEIMKDFGLKPKRTLVLVHDVVDISDKGNAVIVGAIDVPKSYWMVRIAGYHDPHYKVENYFVPVNLGGGRGTIMISATTENASTALIYNILADAILHLNDLNTVITNAPAKASTIYLSPVDYMRISVSPKLIHFKPYKIIAYKLGSYHIRETGETMSRYILIAIYQWTG